MEDQPCQTGRYRDLNLMDDVRIDSGTMRGRDVLIHIVLLPVSLAIAATLLGLIWSIVRW